MILVTVSGIKAFLDELVWGEGAGGLTLGLKTSESVKTSPCIKLTPEQEGEQDLVPGGGEVVLVTTGTFLVVTNWFEIYLVRMLR